MESFENPFKKMTFEMFGKELANRGVSGEHLKKLINEMGALTEEAEALLARFAGELSSEATEPKKPFENPYKKMTFGMLEKALADRGVSGQDLKKLLAEDGSLTKEAEAMLDRFAEELSKL